MNKKLKVVEAGTVDVPQEVAGFAQKSVDQAEAAFDKASDLAHSNMQSIDAVAGAFRSRATDIQLKAMEIAQINMNAAFTFARKAFAANNPADLASLQQDFIRDQFVSLTRQAGELNDLTWQLAHETVKPVHDGILKSVGAGSKLRG